MAVFRKNTNKEKTPYYLSYQNCFGIPLRYSLYKGYETSSEQDEEDIEKHYNLLQL